MHRGGSLQARSVTSSNKAFSSFSCTVIGMLLHLGISLEKETIKNLSQDDGFSSRYSKIAHLLYKCTMLPLQQAAQ
jgi:hypothetical protein